MNTEAKIREDFKIPSGYHAVYIRDRAQWVFFLHGNETIHVNRSQGRMTATVFRVEGGSTYDYEWKPEEVRATS